MENVTSYHFFVVKFLTTPNHRALSKLSFHIEVNGEVRLDPIEETLPSFVFSERA